MLYLIWFNLIHPIQVYWDSLRYPFCCRQVLRQLCLSLVDSTIFNGLLFQMTNDTWADLKQDKRTIVAVGLFSKQLTIRILNYTLPTKSIKKKQWVVRDNAWNAFHTLQFPNEFLVIVLRNERGISLIKPNQYFAFTQGAIQTNEWRQRKPQTQSYHLPKCAPSRSNKNCLFPKTLSVVNMTCIFRNYAYSVCKNKALEPMPRNLD